MSNHFLCRQRGSAFPVVAGVPSEAAQHRRTRAFTGNLIGAVHLAVLCAASPAMADCISDGTTLNCTGNLSPGVVLITGSPGNSANINSPSGVPYTTLNVNSLTAPITPETGGSGVYFLSGGNITVNVDTGSYGIVTTARTVNSGNGIEAWSSGPGGNVILTNSGTVNTAAPFGDFSYAISAFADGSVSLTNHGEITQLGGPTALSAFSNGNVTFVNTGNISVNAGGISVQGNMVYDGGSAIDISSGGRANISNSGNITTVGGAGGLYASSFGNMILTNSGNISAAGPSADGINAMTVSGDLTFSNTGSISTKGYQSFNGIVAASGNNLNFTNSGAISTSGFSNAAGITVSANGNIEFTNSGAISTLGSNAWGIQITGSGTSSAWNVSNSGNISTSGDSATGVSAYTAGSLTLDNKGNIETRGASAYGIDVSSNGSLSASNSGAITTTGDSASGIKADGGAGAESVSNSGSISTSGSNARGMQASANGSAPLSVVNSGAVNTTGSSSQGISATNQASTTLTNSGTVTTSGDNAYGLLAYGATSLTITNSGTVSTSGASSHGIVAVAGSLSGGTSNAPFSVSITGGSVTAAGLDASGINALSIDPTVNMNVNVASGATVTGGSGMGAGVHFGGGGNNTLTNYGAIASSGGLSGYAVLGDTNSYLNQSPLSQTAPVGNNTVNNYGIIRGNVDLGAGQNAFNNYAGATYTAGPTINLNGGTLTNAGTLALGAPGSIQTTALFGNYAQTTSGSLVIALNAPTDQSSQLTVNGNVSVAGSIFVNQTGLPAAGTSEIFKILSATDSISIASNIVLPANTPWVTWRLIYLDTHDVALQETRTSAPQLITNVPPPVTAPIGAPIASASVAAGNWSTISQTGANSIASADQGTGSLNSGNLSVINQGVSGGNVANNASATVTQHTSGGGLASSLINQDSGGASTAAAGNTASVTQNVYLGGVASTSTVNQSGAALNAFIAQGSIGGLDLAVIAVSSYVEQIGGGVTASVSQTADNASSVIIQHGNGTYSGTGAVGALNAKVSQSAGADTSGISQTSANLGRVGVTQDGTGSADLQVRQFANTAANINQGGVGINTSYVTQALGADGASASVNQLGSSNNQSLLDQGAGGSSNVYQTGTGNLNVNQSAVAQSGTGAINVYQGYAAACVPASSGASSNFSGVTQTGAGAITVVQSGKEGLTNLSIVSQDYASTAVVLQTASNASNTLIITQTAGSGNAAFVKQN